MGGSAVDQNDDWVIGCLDVRSMFGCLFGYLLRQSESNDDMDCHNDKDLAVPDLAAGQQLDTMEDSMVNTRRRKRSLELRRIRS